jgi:hypothetical protein
MHLFITSIPEFFRAVWAYVVALFFFYRKEAAPDIEAAIVPLDAIRSSEPVNGKHDAVFFFDANDQPEPHTVVELGTDGFVPSHGQPQATECTDRDTDHTESVCSDTSGRPSRASAVDPVKSRIVDSTFNKVQDKTFSNCSSSLVIFSDLYLFPCIVDVVKSVVVTHNTVIVVPYSAKIEYFEIPEDGAQTAPKRARTTNREFKFGMLFFSSCSF